MENVRLTFATKPHMSGGSSSGRGNACRGAFDFGLTATLVGDG